MEYFKTDIEGRYFGGKGSPGTFRAIINQIPPHRTFISGFLGNCAIMRHKRPAEVNWGIELNPDVCKAWWKADLEKYNITVLCMSWEEVDGCLLDKPDTFLYLDPPYLHETRSSNHRYPFEFDHIDHAVMLSKVLNFKCMVAISHYPCELYDTMLADWRWMDYWSTASNGERRRERLYMNYPEPEELHDYSYFGADYREREKFKRRSDTVFRKIKRMNPLERKALFDKLASRYPAVFSGDAAR